MTKITKFDEVFDRSKIGVGDIVEYQIKGSVFIGPSEDYWIAGVVSEVSPERILIDDKDGVGESVIYVENADRVRIIHRAYRNVSKGEKYGAIDGGGRIYERRKK